MKNWLGGLLAFFVATGLVTCAAYGDHSMGSQHVETVEVAPADWTVYFDRGLVYDKADQLEEAIENYSAAIALDQSQALPYYYRGLIFIDIERYEEAISDLTKAIELQRNHAGMYYDRALAYYYLGEYESAISDFTRTINWIQTIQGLIIAGALFMVGLANISLL